MLFNSYKEMLKYLEKNYKNIRFSISCHILSLRNLDNDLIVNYDLRCTNFLLIDSDISHINARSILELNYKF